MQFNNIASFATILSAVMLVLIFVAVSNSSDQLDEDQSSIAIWAHNATMSCNDTTYNMTQNWNPTLYSHIDTQVIYSLQTNLIMFNDINTNDILLSAIITNGEAQNKSFQIEGIVYQSVCGNIPYSVYMTGPCDVENGSYILEDETGYGIDVYLDNTTVACTHDDSI